MNIKYLRELFQFRELLWALTLREIKIRYKQTFLGVIWAILQPASLAIIFSFVFGIILKVNSGTVPYPIFVYSALVPWTFFSNSMTFGSLSIVNHGNLVTKVYFPRELLPLSAIGAAFFDFVMASIVLLALMVVYGIEPSINFIYVLILVPVLFLLTCGISLIFATVNVLFRDIKFGIPLLLQIWLFLTPVIYSSSHIPEKYQGVLKLNPLVPLIENFRQVTIYSNSPNYFEIFLGTIVSLLIFTVGYWFFKSKEKIFADEM